jgi:hypothetical protein
MTGVAQRKVSRNETYETISCVTDIADARPERVLWMEFARQICRDTIPPVVLGFPLPERILAIAGMSDRWALR